eukprot:94200-Rhodomonas_salina.2
MIDTAEAWHWAAVQPLSRRVNRAAAKAQQQCTEQDRTLAKELKTMEERKKLLLDPEPITDYALSPTGSLYLKAPRPDDPSPRQPLETGESGQEGAKKSPLKSAKVASPFPLAFHAVCVLCLRYAALSAAADLGAPGACEQAADTGHRSSSLHTPCAMHAIPPVRCLPGADRRLGGDRARAPRYPALATPHTPHESLITLDHPSHASLRL